MERVDLGLWKAKEVARLLALVETERRYYQEIVASMPVGLLVLAPDLSIVSSNRAIRKMFGLRGGTSALGQLDTLLPASILDRAREVLNTGTPQTGILAETPLNGGRQLRLGIQTTRAWGDESEQEVLLTIEDVTDFSGISAGSRTATTELALRQEVIGAFPAADVIGNLGATIWAVEIPAMKFVFVNEHGRQLLGFKTNHWLETADFWTERLGPRDRDAVLAAYQPALKPGGPKYVRLEYRPARADHRPAWIYEIARIMSDAAGNPHYVIGVSVDVTERRLLEDQLVQVNRTGAVGKLAARMAHDLNNVLMIVSGYAEEVLHSLPSESPLCADVRQILSATERVAALTNQMLAFTRVQSAPSSTIEINASLQEMDRALRDALGSRIALENNPGLEALAVRVDPSQFYQVISAFVRYARETMPDGGKVTIGVSRTAITTNIRRSDATLHPGDYAVIRIEDTGHHNDNHRAAIFESFLPGKDPETESGPALAQAYALVRQWGGDIAVANAPVTGLIFRIFLPVAAFEAERPRQLEPMLTTAAPETLVRTILVAEDEAGIRGLIGKILRRQGYDVLEAENGAQALQIGGERRIDLLITDVVMPEMGGHELVEELRKWRPGLKVLYVSGYTEEPAIYAQELPPDTAYLQKPFTLGALLDKVKEVLRPNPRA
jgi:signal transduction histidine kinase/CheY-like chemotaxis protein